MVKHLPSHAHKKEMRRMYCEDLQEIDRLQGVAKRWHEKVAGTVPLSESHKIRRLIGHSDPGPGYVSTTEWKEAWLKIVRDEIGKRSNSISADSFDTDALSEVADDNLFNSHEDVKATWANLSVIEKLGAVKDWLKQEADEDSKTK